MTATPAVPTLEEIRKVLERLSDRHGHTRYEDVRAGRELLARLPEQGQIAGETCPTCGRDNGAFFCSNSFHVDPLRTGRIPAPEKTCPTCGGNKGWEKTLLPSGRKVWVPCEACRIPAPESSASTGAKIPTRAEQAEIDVSHFRRVIKSRDMSAQDEAVERMRPRPKGFLAQEHIAHDSEQFDYIRELHEWLWRFVRVVIPGASGSLRDYIPTAFAALQASGQETMRLRAALAAKNSPEITEQLVKMTGWRERAEAAEAKRDAYRKAFRLVTSHDPDWLVSVVEQHADSGADR